ncbi:MAG: 2-oxoacid:acceptor oxidoreductase subunit alpha [Elusimicrobia bacterium]|nr:2-oxoacid:acceptor oxidoreductase subunit alpha [Elusimicrobiota bacterium]
MNHINVVIAGAAGQGVQSAGDILGKTLLRLGYQVFIAQDYQSRVRGGHNFISVRFSDEPLAAPVRRADYLLALNEESVGLRLGELAPEGLAFCLEAAKGSRTDQRLRALPDSVGPEAARGEKFAAVKLLSMLFAGLGFKPEVLAGSVKKIFEGRLKPELLRANLDAVAAVAAFIEAKDVRAPAFQPKAAARGGPSAGRLLVSGNDAVSLGMAAAGAGVYAGYPMTPSTSILNTLGTAGPRLGIAVEQAEDEIAALNIAIGGSYAGVRSACGSSGAGLSLMAESIGLAGITETPVVIYDGQRAGPAIGMATRTEQSDLLPLVHSSHGEFPRAVISPADHYDSFYLAAEAFNIADAWQVPVFFVNDLGQAGSERSVEEYDLSRVRVDRGLFAPEPAGTAMLARYAVTESGVSPRAVPALSNWLVSCDSHEHDENGRLTDDKDNRVRQQAKRMRKLAGMAASFPGPEILNPGKPDCLLAWGSTVGPLLEAVNMRGAAFSVAVFRYLFPLDPEKVRRALAGFSRLITVEQNYTGQLGKLLAMDCGLRMHSHLGKYDGRNLTVEDALELLGSLEGGKP